MAKDENLITNDDTTHLDKQAGQTSNKTGKHSSARKPSNTGPDSYSEHKAPVSGAFGNEERRDDPEEQGGYLNDQAPADKANNPK